MISLIWQGKEKLPFTVFEVKALAMELLEQAEQLPDSECQHHWILESPVGETSAGICKRCGTARRFRNAGEDPVWEEERAAHLAYWDASDLAQLGGYAEGAA